MVNVSNPFAPLHEKRQQIISESDDTALENIRQHALGMMLALSSDKGTVPEEYSVWSAFVGEIESEQRKRKDSR